MSSPTKQQPQKKGGWGSLLSGAVANLESRLDTILAEDNEASARQRAGEAALKDAKGRQRTNSGNLAPPARSSTTGSRDASRTRVNDRLAERLAKAAAAKKAGSETVSGVPSRVASPANDASSVRTSGESRRSADIARSVLEIEKPVETALDTAQPEKGAVAGEVREHGGSTLLTSGLPINPERVSIDSSRPSTEFEPAESSARASSELANGHATTNKDAAHLEVEIAQMREDYAAAEKQRQEEMHAYLEKIDALQAKLKYLAKETVAAAKAANAGLTADSDDAKLAEKDERIALLMEEGEKLSKTELRHLQTIKKLRGSISDKDKAVSEVSKRLQAADLTQAELKQKLRRAEAAERQANEKAKQIVGIEKQVEELRVDRENASELIRTLTSQLKEAKDNADRGEKEASDKASEVDRNKIAALENELEDAQVEKKLAEDRAAAETKKMREEIGKQKERFSVRELELKNETAGLEARVEAMRSRAEEASSDVGSSESNIMLLRQVETLQSQYSLAKANWETVEGTLTARVSALEQERDEVTRRETEVRKKARDATLGKRRLEDEVESAREQAKSLARELGAQREESKELQRRLKRAESGVSDARADMERQRKLWDAELGQRVEEEKAKWQRGQVHDSPATSFARKTSVADLASLHIAPARRAANRVTSHDLAALRTHPEIPRPVSRRSSAMPTPASARPPAHPLDSSPSTSPAISRQESALSLGTNMPPAPSIEIDQDQDFSPHSQSPQTTVNDLMSTSTAGAGAGPSIQLVSRMSAAVRRLESEKSAFRDEIARVVAQRDGARDEVVGLMREMESRREEAGRIASLEKELKERNERYEASLEMLGEREEEVQELRQDVAELKRMYRELVEEKMPVR